MYPIHFLAIIQISFSLAKNQINEVTREREVNDILPLINHIIRYTGILYTPKESDDTFTLDILNGGKWDSPIDKDLKD